MSASPERCPTCGQAIPTLRAFQTHLQAVAGDELHVTALWTLLGVDYAALKAEDRAGAEQRARDQGWTLLQCRGGE